MDDHTVFRDLRNVLVKLYETEAGARRVAYDAHINVGLIALGDSAVNFWTAILKEAINSNRIEALISVVHKEFAQNEDLRNVYIKALQKILLDKDSYYRPTDGVEQKPPQSRPRPKRSITIEWWPGGVILSFVTILIVVLAVILLSNQFRTYEGKLAERDKELSQAYAIQDAQSTEIALVRATATQHSEEVAMLQTKPTDLSVLLTNTTTRVLILTPTSTTTPMLTATLTPTSTKTPTPMSTCPYQGKTDNETIINLIQAEATAVNTENIAIIQAIFSPDAVFHDYGSDSLKTWHGPLARYRDDLFKFIDFKEVQHFDIIPVGRGIAGNVAWYTSGSNGFWEVAGGDWQEMFNGSLKSTPATKFGSDHWILGKNSAGCWVITQMDFNAGHIPFPG